MATKTCSTCQGSGETAIEEDHWSGYEHLSKVVGWESCGTCGGSGRVEVPD